MRACQSDFDGQVSPESLQCQIGTGTSATRQRRIHANAAAAGKNPGRAVVAHLIEEFHAEL